MLSLGEGRGKDEVVVECVGGVSKCSTISLESPLGPSGTSTTPPQSPTMTREFQ